MIDKKHSTLILGLGNDILTDDGIGIKVVQKIQKDLAKPNVAFHTAAVGGLEIPEMIKDYGGVIIIDAIKTANAIPGTVYHLTPFHFKGTLHLSNFHDVSFLAALDFAEHMEISIPDQIDILAIEIIEDLIFSDEFSPPIAKKYEQIYREVLAAVKELI